MLSSLFESRNSTSKVVENKQLFDLTTKKVQLPKPIVKQVVEQQKADDKNKPKQIIQKDRPQATIFVGNVHLETKHNELKTLFSKYGKVQKVWFRSIPVEANKMGRKASHLLKKYIEGANVMNAYVRFEKQQSVQEACKENGTQFKQLTLRVTPCKQKDTDTQSSVFVGNLSHDIQQQQLRDHFSAIGKIISVRVIKSRQTNKGIGIGYVHFSTKQQMKEAINKLNNTQLLGRKIRVKKAVAQDRLEKKTKKIQQKYGKKFKPSKKQQTSKNEKAIQIRKKGKQIKMKRQQTKTKQIRK